jgi:hypothetical protein
LKIQQKINKCLAGINEPMLCYQNRKWEEYIQNEDPTSFDEESLMMFEKNFVQYQILCLYMKYEKFNGNDDVNWSEYNKCLLWIAILTKFIFVSENEMKLWF